jgi:hypothetical protein
VFSAALAGVTAVATSALFRLAVLLGGLALLVRLKLKIGRVLLAAPFIAAALFWSGELPAGFWREATKDGGAFFFETGALIGLIALIDVFGHVLKETESLPRLMRALQALFPDQRIALGGMPAVIGLLPMPGGAMVSAPAVKEMADASETTVSPEDRTLVNYWFRHLWEYIFPVYPAVVAAATIWNVDLAELASRQLVLTLAAIAAGLALVLTRVPAMRAPAPAGPSSGSDSGPSEAPDAPDPGRLAHVGAIAKGLAPIAAVLAIWFGLRTLGPSGYGFVDWKPWGKFTVLAALVPVIGALALIGRLPAKWLRERLRGCMPLDMLMLLVGAMVFQKVMAASGAVAGVASELEGAPLFVVIFALPFIAGLLTGVALAFVLVGFPLVAGVVMTGGHADPAATTLAYAAGYAGIMLSPVHICLVLTREYFGARLGTVYRRLALPVAAVVTVAFIVYFTLTRL